MCKPYTRYASRGVVQMKQRVNISITEDTAERLKMYAWENHKTVSQAITDWIWSEKVKNTQIRGQLSLTGIMKV